MADGACPRAPQRCFRGRGRSWPRLRECAALVSRRGPRTHRTFSPGSLWGKWLFWCVTRNTVT